MPMQPTKTRMNKRSFDFIIAGSGFAGSLAALALNQSGYRVCLIEKNRHPRFAVGESSTPIADMILRRFAGKYSLPFLERLSRYGSWQEHYPGILCGIKRGFSYFFHKSGQTFTSDKNYTNQLLVAASANDQDSDTNWYRADVDTFLIRKVSETEIEYLDQTQITSAIQSTDDELIVKVHNGNKTERLTCKWLVDATGSPTLASELFDIRSSSSHFQTHSSAIYSHFWNVQPWSDYIRRKLQLPTKIYPFNPDHSALHHLIDEGWMWNLRFNNNLVSSGFLIDQNQSVSEKLSNQSDLAWESLISKYPSISECYQHAHLAKIPGKIVRTGRLQRQMDKMYNKHWIALNHTAGFVDPLHSTGIAHTLSGLERILDLFISSGGLKKSIEKGLERHTKAVHHEFKLIDLLVAGCYLSRNHFDLFHAYTMVYFACTIHYEQRRLSGDLPGQYLNAGDSDIQNLVEVSFQDLSEVIDNGPDRNETKAFIERTRNRIKPYNTAGLLDCDKQNMYHHTAVTLK
jgi:tetracycline 7-halogenase / FADH2 O2-dependent halogenase